LKVNSQSHIGGTGISRIQNNLTTKIILAVEYILNVWGKYLHFDVWKDGIVATFPLYSFHSLEDDVDDFVGVCIGRCSSIFQASFPSMLDGF